MKMLTADCEYKVTMGIPKVQIHSLVWIFIISSVIGVVVEMVFCYIFKGYLECRQGVLYGPFNQVYGLGAVVLTYGLFKIKERGAFAVFAVSAMIGGIFETVCSVFQELCFGTVSWDYTWMPISLFGGRTNILYILFFGVLGVVYIYICHPFLLRIAQRIHTGKGVAVTWLIALFMVANLSLSAVVVNRWVARQEGVPASNRIDNFVDQNYPDDMLKIVFPTMVISG